MNYILIVPIVILIASIVGIILGIILAILKTHFEKAKKVKLKKAYDSRPLVEGAREWTPEDPGTRDSEWFT